METLYTEKERDNSKDVEGALSSISRKELQKNGWPVIAAVSKEAFSKYNEGRQKSEFWKEVFNPSNFLYPQKGQYNPEDHILFISHSFLKEGKETVFRAITTTPERFVEDPVNMINYNLHGKPCEIRSGGDYPHIDFWDFYDNLDEGEQDNYPIPDSNWRKGFYKKNL